MSAEPTTMTIWLVVAEHKEVPGILYPAFWTEEDANRRRDDLVAQFGHDLDYCDVIPTTLSGCTELAAARDAMLAAAERLEKAIKRLDAAMEGLK